MITIDEAQRSGAAAKIRFCLMFIKDTLLACV